MGIIDELTAGAGSPTGIGSATDLGLGLVLPNPISIGLTVGKLLGFDPVGDLTSKIFGGLFGGGKDRNINVPALQLPPILKSLGINSDPIGVSSYSGFGVRMARRNQSITDASKLTKKLLIDLGLNEDAKAFTTVMQEFSPHSAKSPQHAGQLSAQQIQVLATTLSSIMENKNAFQGSQFEQSFTDFNLGIDRNRLKVLKGKEPDLQSLLRGQIEENFGDATQPFGGEVVINTKALNQLRQETGEIESSLNSGVPRTDFFQQSKVLEDSELRPDGSPKGPGFIQGLVASGGKDVSEFSVQSDAVKVDGKRIDFPTIVRTLTQSQIDLMLNDIIPNKKPIPEPIMQKAIAHAKKRLSEGKSVFFETLEDPELPPTEKEKTGIIDELTSNGGAANGEENAELKTGLLNKIFTGIQEGKVPKSELSGLLKLAGMGISFDNSGKVSKLQLPSLDLPSSVPGLSGSFGATSPGVSQPTSQFGLLGGRQAQASRIDVIPPDRNRGLVQFPIPEFMKRNKGLL